MIWQPPRWWAGAAGRMKSSLLGHIARVPLARTLAGKVLERNEQDLFSRANPKELFSRFRMHGMVHRPETQPGKKYVLTDVAFTPRTRGGIGETITSLDALTDREIAGATFYVYFTCDSDALPALRRIKENGGKYVPHLDFSKTSYRFVNRMAYESMRRTWEKSSQISHLTPIVHENLCEALELTKDVDGDYLEIGVYLGGSALTATNYLAALAKSHPAPVRKVWLMDTFGGFNYPAAEASADIIWHGTHTLDGPATKQRIKTNLECLGVPFEIVEGDICRSELPSGIKKLSVANIDVDLYEPTLAALSKVSSLISEGGIIVCEDPASTPGLYGAYVAMNDFLDTPAGRRFFTVFKQGQYFLLRR